MLGELDLMRGLALRGLRTPTELRTPRGSPSGHSPLFEELHEELQRLADRIRQNRPFIERALGSVSRVSVIHSGAQHASLGLGRPIFENMIGAYFDAAVSPSERVFTPSAALIRGVAHEIKGSEQSSDLAAALQNRDSTSKLRSPKGPPLTGAPLQHDFDTYRPGTPNHESLDVSYTFKLITEDRWALQARGEILYRPAAYTSTSSSTCPAGYLKNDILPLIHMNLPDGTVINHWSGSHGPATLSQGYVQANQNIMARLADYADRTRESYQAVIAIDKIKWPEVRSPDGTSKRFIEIDEKEVQLINIIPLTQIAEDLMPALSRYCQEPTTIPYTRQHIMDLLDEALTYGIMQS